MPEIFYSNTQRAWVKECTGCDYRYEVQAENITEAEKLMAEFYSTRRKGPNGLESRCRSCLNRDNGGIRNKPRIGIYNRHQLLEMQDGKCAVCEVEIRLNGGGHACVDHDHETKLERGLLCNRCNVRMSAVDDEEWLAKAIAYRDSYR